MEGRALACKPRPRGVAEVRASGPAGGREGRCGLVPRDPRVSLPELNPWGPAGIDPFFWRQARGLTATAAVRLGPSSQGVSGAGQVGQAAVRPASGALTLGSCFCDWLGASRTPGPFLPVRPAPAQTPRAPWIRVP